jgi:hypothetical protein
MNDIDRRYDRMFDELRADRHAWRAEACALRAEMQGLRTDLQGLRTDVQAGCSQLHGELLALQRHMMMTLALLGAALLGVFGAAQL